MLKTTQILNSTVKHDVADILLIEVYETTSYASVGGAICSTVSFYSFRLKRAETLTALRTARGFFF